MTDHNGRVIDYLRISVTDRCNLRCRYCMPEEGIPLMKHEDILTYDEITRICAAGARLGIRKVKLTGGEPLVRRGLDSLIEMLHHIAGIEDITLTSNGYLLGEQAGILKEAGLSSVNISLDTLHAERFFNITRRDCFYRVLEGINTAIKAGLNVKINCAVMPELTPSEVLDFAEFSCDRQIPVRFIEMMPIGQGRAIKAMDNEELADILRTRYPDLHRISGPAGNGPAVYYGFRNGENLEGCVGFISAVHHKFCKACNRVRLTSDGFLKLCLDSPEGVDLRTPLRNGAAERELAQIMEKCILQKPESHHFGENREETGLNMNQIGG